MADIGFYHLLSQPLERALPKLLEKVLQQDMRAVVVAGSEERVEALNDVLWSYSREGFLPHGSTRDGYAELQPVWLSTTEERPNGATVLIAVDGVKPDAVDDFDRVVEMFDGRDDTAVATARDHWKSFKAAGHAVTYWQQTDRGGWEKKA